jgi:hypothetical protein
MRSLALLCFGAFLLSFITAAPPATPNDQADPWLGSFSGDGLRLEAGRGGGQHAYAGTIWRRQQKFPFSGRVDGTRMSGRFQSGDDAFDFTASLDGPTLTLQTGGATYRMTRVEPPKPTTRDGATSRPAPAATMPTSRPSAPPKLTNTVLYDPMMDCPAAIVTAPDGWKCLLDILWRQNPYDPAVIAGTVSAPNGPARLTIYPRLSFIDGVPESGPSAGGYMGSEIRQPVASPADYVRQIILPRFRPDVTGPRILRESELRDFARDQLPKFQKVPGVQVRTSRIRVAYLLNGIPVEEDFVCTVGIVPLSQGMVAWGAECSSYRAARGELDAMQPRLRRIESSLQVELPWYSGVLQVSEAMQNDLPASLSDAARLSRYVSQRSSRVSDVAREAFARRQRVLARCDADLDAAIREGGR